MLLKPSCPACIWNYLVDHKLTEMQKKKKKKNPHVVLLNVRSTNANVSLEQPILAKLGFCALGNTDQQ
jgi:hypothetical protein